MCRLPEYEYSVPVTKLWPVQLSTSASHYLYLKHTKGLSVSPVLPHHHRNTGGSITTTLSGEDYWWSSWSWHPPLMTHFKLPHPPTHSWSCLPVPFCSATPCLCLEYHLPNVLSTCSTSHTGSSLTRFTYLLLRGP